LREVNIREITECGARESTVRYLGAIERKKKDKSESGM
jgi:hypothetical protein